MDKEDCKIPKEIIEREVQELSDLLAELSKRFETLKRHLDEDSNRDSNSLGGILFFKPSVT